MTNPVANPLEHRNTTLHRRAVPKVVYYKDLNALFQYNDKPLNLEGSDAIRNQILNVLLTFPGSDHFEPEFGSRLPYRLFEPADSVTEWELTLDVFEAVERWMGDRIEIIKEDSYVKQVSDNAGLASAYDIVLSYIELEVNKIADFQVRVVR